MKDGLQNRLFQYAEEPPAKVWKDIEYALEEGSAALSHRLESYAVPPPPSAWKNIEASLQQSPAKENTRPVPLRKLFRYAAAAAVLFIVVSGLRYLVNMPEKQKISVVQKQETTPPPAEATPDSEPNIEAPATITKRPAQKAVPSAPPVTTTNPPRSTNGNRYVTVENDEGQQVRLSKKVVPVFDCAEARVRASKRCQDNIRELQEKIGSAFTSPTADFAGLMDMIKSLEKQQ